MPCTVRRNELTDIRALVRTIPDYPKPGIMFRDITTLLGDAKGLTACVQQLAAPYVDSRRYRGARVYFGRSNR